jgi:hypothetical protein
MSHSTKQSKEGVSDDVKLSRREIPKYENFVGGCAEPNFGWNDLDV